jgi:hypothetical protein
MQEWALEYFTVLDNRLATISPPSAFGLHGSVTESN